MDDAATRVRIGSTVTDAEIEQMAHMLMKEKGAAAMILKHVSGDGYSPQDFIANHADSITQNWSSTTSATTYVSGGAALGLGASSCHMRKASLTSALARC